MNTVQSVMPGSSSERRRPCAPALAVVCACSLSLASPLRGQSEIDLGTLSLPRWAAVQDLRIGSIDGPNDAFVAPAILRMDEAGLIYVLDGGLRELRVFDRSGRFVRTIGRQGQGPGEYVAPAAFGFLGDTVWVGDGGTGRITLFQRNGDVIESFAFGREQRVTHVPVDMLGPDRFLVVAPPGPAAMDVPDGLVAFPQSVLLVDRDASILDTMVTYVAVYPGILARLPDRPGAMFPFQPIRTQPFVSYSSRTRLVREVHFPRAQSASSGRFRIVLRTPDGRVVSERTFRYRPTMLPATVRDSIRALVDAAPAGVRDVIRRHVELPEFQPPVSTGLADAEDGSYWLARERFQTSGLEFLVLDADLNPLATILLPPKAVRRIGPVTAEHFWVLEKDEFDVSYLVRYRIRR